MKIKQITLKTENFLDFCHISAIIEEKLNVFSVLMKSHRHIANPFDFDFCGKADNCMRFRGAFELKHRIFQKISLKNTHFVNQNGIFADFKKAMFERNQVFGFSRELE